MNCPVSASICDHINARIQYHMARPELSYNKRMQGFGHAKPFATPYPPRFRQPALGADVGVLKTRAELKPRMCKCISCPMPLKIRKNASCTISRR